MPQHLIFHVLVWAC